MRADSEWDAVLIENYITKIVVSNVVYTIAQFLDNLICVLFDYFWLLKLSHIFKYNNIVP